MTAAPPSPTPKVAPRPTLSASWWPTLAEVDEARAAGKQLLEEEARVDLSQSGHGPKPDEWWAARWGWTAQDVHDLRTTDWRTREPLPYPRPSKDPSWREPRRRRGR